MAEKPNIPRWLKKTQQNSWEPEIFISGIVLFGLFQIPEHLQDFRHLVKREVWWFSDVDNLVAVLSTSLQWLILGLVLHLFFRGIWIGLIGLSYVFPSGVNLKSLSFQDSFEKKIEGIPPISKQIIRLEKICSSIFSISYFLFMSILGGYIFIVVTLAVPIYCIVLITGISIMDVGEHEWLTIGLTIYVFAVLGAGLIYLIDFLSLGMMKRFRFVARIYRPIYDLLSTLTFSHLYRGVYYVLITNFKTWKIVVFNSVFVFLTILMIDINGSDRDISERISNLDLWGTTQGNFASANYYRNSPTSGRFHEASIQSDVITGGVLSLFVTLQVALEDSIQRQCAEKKFTSRSSWDRSRLDCMAGFYLVSVDDSLYADQRWYFHLDPVTDHKGILSHVDIGQLPRGSHTLTVTLNKNRRERLATIHFFKE